MIKKGSLVSERHCSETYIGDNFFLRRYNVYPGLGLGSKVEEEFCRDVYIHTYIYIYTYASRKQFQFGQISTGIAVL